MKFTLLQIVQDILSDIDSDEVNSINDTPEAMQVANIVMSTYNAMMSNRNWPHTAKLINLVAYSDNNYPHLMTIDDNIKELISVYYNKIKVDGDRDVWDPVKWVEPDDMLRIFYSRNTTDTNTRKIVRPNGEVHIIKTNQAPTYFTSFDDTTLVFDSYDMAVDATLMAAKSQMRAYTIPSFELTDDFIPDLPDEAFALLIEEAKSKSSMKIAQKVDQKAEQESRRQNQWQSRKDWRISGGIKYIRFGKKGGYHRDPTFKQDR